MKTINAYLIGEHPNKELCFEYIRNNWGDLNQFSLIELVTSINKLSSTIGGTVKYSISLVPDRGEYITFSDYDENILNGLDTESCPLTGVFWDMEIIEGLKSGNMSKVLDTLHDETEYQYSDEALKDFCDANEYYFFENGKFAN